MPIPVIFSALKIEIFKGSSKDLLGDFKSSKDSSNALPFYQIIWLICNKSLSSLLFTRLWPVNPE